MIFLELSVTLLLGFVHLPHPVVASPGAGVDEELLPGARWPGLPGGLEEDLGVHAHVKSVDGKDLPCLGCLYNAHAKIN